MQRAGETRAKNIECAEAPPFRERLPRIVRITGNVFRDIDEIDGREEFPCVAGVSRGSARTRRQGGGEGGRSRQGSGFDSQGCREGTAPSLCDLDRDVLQVPTDREKHELW